VLNSVGKINNCLIPKVDDTLVEHHGQDGKHHYYKITVGLLRLESDVNYNDLHTFRSGELYQYVTSNLVSSLLKTLHLNSFHFYLKTSTKLCIYRELCIRELKRSFPQMDDGESNERMSGD
jgi:hypothetical protein